MDSIIESVRSPEFLAALRWGGVVGLVGLLAGLAWRRLHKKPAPIAGLATTLAAVLAMPIARPLPTELFAGLVLLLLAGIAFPWTRRGPLLPELSALPGAWLIGRSGLPGRGWVLVLAVVLVALGGPIISRFDEPAEGYPVPTWMFAISAAGAWATVPDTEEILVLLGGLALPTLLAWPLKVARLGSSGAYALVGLYMWVVAWGGRGREGSIVGAVACLGGFVLSPLMTSLKRPPVRLPALAVIALHLILVIVGARIAGLRENPLAAASIAALALAITGTGCWIWLRRRDREYVPKRIDGSAEAP